MSHLRPLQNELFKYRKRKRLLLDGGMPGFGQERYRKFTTPRLDAGFNKGQKPHEGYLGEVPDSYRPNFFSPSVDWNDYETDEIFEMQPHQPSQSKLFMPFPDIPEQSEQFDYQKARRLEEIFMEVMGQPYHLPDSFDGLDLHIENDSERSLVPISGIEEVLDSPKNENEHVPSDLDIVSEALNFLNNRLPENHQDIINLRMAQKELVEREMTEIRENPLFEEQYNANDNNWKSNLGTGDPYQNDDLTLMQDIQLLEQQPMAENTLPGPVNDMFSDQQVCLDEIVEQEHGHPQPESSMPEEATVESDSFLQSSVNIDEFCQFDQEMPDEVICQDQISEINHAIERAAEHEEPEDEWEQEYDPLSQMSLPNQMQYQQMMNPDYMPNQMGPGPM